MDTPVAQPQNYRERLEDSIVDTMLNKLEKEELTEDEMSIISAYVLDHVDNVKDNRTAIEFLEALAEKWDIFSTLLKIERAEMKGKVEAEVADGVLLLLQHGKLDNAIKLAKSATDQPINQ